MIRFLFRVLAFLLLAYAFGYAVFAVMLPRPAGDERTDAIVVLTGGSGRLERGFELIERGLAQRMLISGVDRTVRREELIPVFGVDPRLFDCCIALDRESSTPAPLPMDRPLARAPPLTSLRLVTNEPTGPAPATRSASGSAAA